MKANLKLIYKFLKRNRNKAYSASEIGRYVNRETDSCYSYYQCLAALVGSRINGKEPVHARWAKDLGIFNSVDRTIINGKSFYQCKEE